MVKTTSKIFFSVLSLCIVFLVIGCDVDLAGLFISTDLDERLKEKDNFRYLTTEDISSVSGSYSFIVMTDTHVKNGNISDLKKIQSAITSTGAKFVVNLGDISQNGKEEDIKAVTEYTKTLTPISTPYYPVIGNHDIYFGNWSVWKEYIGSTRYKVKGGDFYLFILDSANAFIGKAQTDWLERELKNIPAGNKVFVFTHSDFFVQDKIKIQQTYDLAERARIMSILTNDGKCKIVFMGHSHERVEKEFGGIKYVSIEDYESTRVYCIVTVTPTGVSYEFKKL